MKQVIHIFGAAGSGTSTLGRALAERLGLKFMDSDDYYWLPTEPRFTAKRPPEERLRLMEADIERSEGAVISGAFAGWGDPLIKKFTLAIRLVTPTDVRIQRIKEREYRRFGDRISEGGDMYAQHQDFLLWAASYDDGDETMRSKAQHDKWQAALPCKSIVLCGLHTVEELTEEALRAIPGETEHDSQL